MVALESSRGRILFDAQIASLDIPPFANSAMDGYALNTGSVHGKPPYTLQCIGTSLAGHPFSGRIQAGECIRITTGAPLPADVDCVVAQEDTSIRGDTLVVNTTLAAGDNVRHAGNDVARGSVLLEAGTVIGPFDLAWLASAGITRIMAFRRPRIAVFSSGDELREPGAALGPGQIYDSNRHAMLQLLQSLPVAVTDLGALPDDPSVIASSLSAAAQSHDLLLTSGGVSVGSADYLKEVITRLGSLDLWRLNLKPGKPLAFGRINRCLFMGLPGNPVSTIVTFLLLARPAILRLAGCRNASLPATFQVKLRQNIQHTPGREEYQRGRLVEQGREVEVTGDQSSNRLATFSGAHCLIRVPKDAGNLAPGTLVTVLPFSGLLG